MKLFSALRKPRHQTGELYFRRTIKYPGRVEGVGLHSGENMILIFHPAAEGTGIVFCRKNGSRMEYLPASLDHVIDTSWAVTLGFGDFHVQTVEHLMYSISVLGVSDLLIEVQGHSEIPILDGSAQEFLACLEDCEFHDYPTEILPIVINKPVMVTDGQRYLVGLPHSSFKISYSIDFSHPLLKNQSLQVEYSESFFREKIGRARTFGFLRDVEIMKSRGLAQGGTTENVLVFSADSTVNLPRFQREALYHKVLDLIGDLALVGRPIQGHLLASRAGHSLDVAFGKKILAIEQKP